MLIMEIDYNLNHLLYRQPNFKEYCSLVFQLLGLFIGKVKINVEPNPSSDITEILPPIFNTRPLQIANPNPIPCSKSLNCTNRAKILSNSSLGMPQPVSKHKT